MVHHTIGFPLTRLLVSTQDELTVTEVVTITPNPFEEYITVRKIYLATEVSYLALFDVAGREVLSVPLSNSSQHISTAQLGKGLYFYRVIDEAGRIKGNGKLMKQ